MVQVIPRKEQNKPNTAQIFGEAFGAGMNAISEHRQQQKMQEAVRKENEAIKRETGIDLSGVMDPKIRQQAVQLAGQAKNKEKEIAFKNSERRKLLGEIRGNPSQQQGQQLAGMGQDEQMSDAQYYYNQADQLAAAQENQLANQAFKKGQAIEKQEKEFQERLREKDAVKSLLRETGDYDEDELEDLSTKYDLITARSLNLKKKEPSPYEPTSQKLAAERTDKYITDVTNKGRAAEEKLRGLEEGMALHKAGATGYKFMNTLAKYFDNPALADPASKGFNAAMKSQYSGIGDIVKGKVSNFEFSTFEKRIASAEDSPQAAEILMVAAMMESQIAVKEKELLEKKRMEYYQKGESPPADFDLQVTKELKPYADMILHQTNDRISNILNPTKKNNENKAQFDQIFKGLL